MRENIVKYSMKTLNEYFDYNATTGELRWKIRPPHGRKAAGELAGSIYRNGYRMVRVGGQRFKVARLCWFLHYGVWPVNEIDHIDGVRDNDRISNLREATRAQNQANASYAHANTTGFRGVSRTQQGRWIACISINCKNKNLGTFDTPEQAHAVFLKAAKERSGEFTFAR